MGTQEPEATRDSELRRSEQLLAGAATADQVAEAHAILKRAIYQKRRREDQGLGPLAQTFKVAMQIWDSEKADGIPRPDRVKHLEQSVRAAWPQGRDWKYLCDRCQDTGLIMRVCERGARCNGVSFRSDHPHAPSGKYRRLCTHDRDSSYTHDYGVPCWCAKGKDFDPTTYEQRLTKRASSDGDFTQATTMTRPGR